MTRTVRRAGGTTALATALWLFAAWGLLCPLLVPLGDAAILPVVALAVPAALGVGWLAAAAMRRPGAVARRAAEAARRTVLGGAAVALLSASQVAFGASPIRAACLTVAVFGGTLSGAVVAALAAFIEGRGQTGRGLGYQRKLVALVLLLVSGAWLFAGAHVVAVADQVARDEAHAGATDLAGLGALALRTRGTAPATLAAALAPSGGFAAIFDERGHPIAAAGVTNAEAIVSSPEGCYADHRRLPCASRSLDDGRRIVVGVPAASTALSVAKLAGSLGGGVLLATLLLALALARATAGELNRTTHALGRLQAHGWGLERPVGVGTDDELGELNVAIGTLRTRLEGELAETAASLARASEAEREQGNFLTMVGAELRAPLDAVQREASAIAEAGRLTGEQGRDLELIVKGVKELHGLIDTVLGLSAEDPSRRMELRLGEVDLAALAKEVARQQRPFVETRKVKLSVEALGSVPPVRGDAVRLRQVLTNLITNAVKFTEDGKVEVEVRQEGERVELSVRDQGPGIAPEALPRLFREFEQAGVSSPVRGTGLGLAICKRLVEAHGGSISVQSVLGGGSTFQIALPLDGPPDGSPARKRVSVPTPSAVESR